MEIGHFQIWFEHCMMKLVAEKRSLLLLDAYGTHKSREKIWIKKENRLQVKIKNNNQKYCGRILIDAFCL